MEEMPYERWKQIATAIFDRYVSKRMIGLNFIITEDGIDDQDLSNFAKQLDCKPGILRAAVVNSCSRITGENLNLPISLEDENSVFEKTIKHQLKEYPLSLLNYKREFGKAVHELNHTKAGLHVNVDELKSVIGPLHLEALTDFYQN